MHSASSVTHRWEQTGGNKNEDNEEIFGAQGARRLNRLNHRSHNLFRCTSNFGGTANGHNNP
jgi:hypothetical protein